MVGSALRPLSLEAGSAPPSAADFARWNFLPLQSESDLSHSDLAAIGTHEVRFTLFGIPLTTKLTVADTVPPSFTLKDLAVLGGDPVAPEDLIAEAADFSDFTYEMSCVGDPALPGTHEMRFVFRDEHGNSAEGTANLTVYGAANAVTLEAGSTRSNWTPKAL